MILNKIFQVFPTPKFLNMPYAGISISDSSVHCIEFSRKNHGLNIEKYSEKPIPPEVIISGEVINKEVLISILQGLKNELDLKYVKVSLPEEKAYLFNTKIPMLGGGSVTSAVESKIEENVPVPPGELIFDYRLSEHKEKNHIDVVVSTIQISVVDMYVDIMEKAGLSLLSLEIESQAITRALLPPDNKGTSLIVNFGQDKVGLYVASNRTVHFTSTVNTKGESVNSPDFLSQEIKKLYMYWHSLKENIDEPERKIEQIVACGENFEENVVQYLSSHNQTKVLLGNVWTNVFDINKTVPEISFSDSLRYSAAIGLALPVDDLM